MYKLIVLNVLNTLEFPPMSRFDTVYIFHRIP